MTKERFLAYVNSVTDVALQRLKHIGPAKANIILLLRAKEVLVDSTEEFGTTAALSVKKTKESMQDFALWTDVV